MTHHTLQVVMTTDCVTPVLVDSLREHWNKYGVFKKTAPNVSHSRFEQHFVFLRPQRATRHNMFGAFLDGVVRNLNRLGIAVVDVTVELRRNHDVKFDPQLLKVVSWYAEDMGLPIMNPDADFSNYTFLMKKNKMLVRSRDKDVVQLYRCALLAAEIVNSFYWNGKKCK